MSKWKEMSEGSKKRWEQNADFWDEKMGEHSNRFHREIIRPDTERLLSIKQNDRVLDIACGNGNFSKRLVEFGAHVTAFDYSYKMIENSKKRCSQYLDRINFRVVDATKYEEIIGLREFGPFDKAVSNMAIMDISDVEPLLIGVYELLKPNGILVFSTIHPCFQSPRMRQIVETEDMGDGICVRKGIQIFEYITPCVYEGIGISGQPVSQFYYHRPLNKLLKMCFDIGFVLNGFEEPVFELDETCSNFDWNEIPPVIIIRLLKTP
ncbi:UNVERIFIED_CONTAM: methyltransferase family protein [Acetivibrio alkalicellulosi]